MEELVRGFMIHHTGRHIASDPELRSKVSPAVLAEVERNTTEFQAMDWRPREQLKRLWQAIADVSGPNEEDVYNALFRCGETVGGYSTSTFFRLLLKVLTPKMFASRFGEFYKRDQQGGEGVVLEVGQKHLVLAARGIAGYDHFGPISSGWASVPLKGMGLKNVKMTCAPWSLAEPGPNEVRFTATWE